MSDPRPRVLIQLDTDPQPSTFDAVVAADAGVQHLLRHGGVEPAGVEGLVHGAMFTRGGDDLRQTAIFVGGSDVGQAEALLEAVERCFFGPMRVSVMLDPSGANTTAAAAVLSAARHGKLRGAEALVLAATGPVGRRVVRLLAREGAHVRAASRSRDRAEEVCAGVRAVLSEARLEAVETATAAGLTAALEGTEVIVAAGAAGVQLLSAGDRAACDALRVAVDLSAVPPLGLEGIELTDKGAEREGVFCYGALGVGGTKMKIHKRAVGRLFEQNDLVLDAEEMFALGRDL